MILIQLLSLLKHFLWLLLFTSNCTMVRPLTVKILILITVENLCLSDFSIVEFLGQNWNMNTLHYCTLHYAHRLTTLFKKPVFMKLLRSWRTCGEWHFKDSWKMANWLPIVVDHVQVSRVSSTLKRCTIHSRSNVALKGYFPLKIANSAIFYEGLVHISTTLDIQCLTILSINTKVIAGLCNICNHTHKHHF